MADQDVATPMSWTTQIRHSDRCRTNTDRTERAPMSPDASKGAPTALRPEVGCMEIAVPGAAGRLVVAACGREAGRVFPPMQVRVR